MLKDHGKCSFKSYQPCPIKLSNDVSVHHMSPNIVTTSNMWLLSIINAVSVTEKLSFKLN